MAFILGMPNSLCVKALTCWVAGAASPEKLLASKSNLLADKQQ
ncbi:hypothetical protein [Neobacillus sp. NPDC093127]